MNVNIVLLNDQHAIYQQALWLIDGNGWAASDKPDPNADVNYYMPYLKWELDEHPNTPTAALFTHYEQGTAWKVDKWQDAAMFIDMPIVEAPMYCSVLKNARVVTACVDRDRFTPGQRPANKRLNIGVAGVGQPRKGPKLIVDLFYQNAVECELSIIGKLWPFPHRYIEPDDLPDWYRSLDIYLCTSLIEGIPLPVLEALATDTKVVIPHGVGICDQLPEMEGIRHYDKGYGPDMLRAIKQAAEDKPSEGSLRAVTEDYTIEDWCESHYKAMEELCESAYYTLER